MSTDTNNKMGQYLEQGNSELKSRFSSVAEYLAYKGKSLYVVEFMMKVFGSPYILQGFMESLRADNPYAIGALWVKNDHELLTAFNAELYDHMVDSLDFLQRHSGDALAYETVRGEDFVFTFVYIDPAKVDTAIKYFERLSKPMKNAPDEMSPLN